MISGHDPSLNLLRSVLESENVGHSLMRGVKPEYFWDAEYGKVWTFILYHWKDYGKVPDMETVLQAFPDLATLLLRVRAVEPPEYYADKIIEGGRVTVNAVHPGQVATSIWRESVPLVGPFIEWVMRFAALAPERGADNSIYLASSPEVEGVTGKYFIKRRAVASSTASYDEAAAQELWRVSEAITSRAVVVS